MPAPNDPTFRKPLTEGDLRAAKQDAGQALLEQARAFGAEPRGEAIERFVAPILEKVNRDHEELLLKRIDPNEAPRQPSIADRDDVLEVKTEELGTYDPSDDTFTPNAAGAAALKRRIARGPVTLNGRALALVVRKTKADPDFKTLRETWAIACFRPMPEDARRMAKTAILERLLQQYTAKYGTDPRAEVLRLESGAPCHG